ncbi:multi-sensor signal transduction histidine kinase [Natrialba hulunbeirensis JCM 10989]|uniref:histidine kinase n=1 Tax=Natrialba hulunbeirensis JCM 10989 TaxID=1227493 RepID=L9ZMJ7_9EURY|nr:PAS domain S-box protein [Natrialba hulunbeirensis]ELY87569.1 multi-sensor signal transduction histidine kinase [Natrialba hulunbeirensis JCM 10989]
MSRAHILCVSRDPSTRAALTLAFTDAPASVSVVPKPELVLDQLESRREQEFPRSERGNDAQPGAGRGGERAGHEQHEHHAHHAHRERIDAIIIDVDTIDSVSAFVTELESVASAPPSVFAYWGEGGAGNGSRKESTGEETAASGERSNELPTDSNALVSGDTDSASSLPVLAELSIPDTPKTAGGTRERSSTPRERETNTLAESGDIAATVLSSVDAGTPNGGAGFPELERTGGRSVTGTDDDGDAVDVSHPELVATVRRELADTTAPQTVEQVLRTVFTERDAFVFAWVGEYDRGEHSVVPWATDPEATEWPIHRTFRVGSGVNPLLERALYSQRLQTQDLASQPDLTIMGGAFTPAPFHDRAREHGARSIAVAPLATDTDRYGVLVVYAPTPFTADTRRTVRAVADVASHVLETIAIRGQLEQQERTLHRYERLVKTAGDGIFVLDGSGHVMTVNDAFVEMTGYSREWLLGEHISLLFDNQTIEHATETVRSLIESDGRSATIEVPLETKAGSYVTCEAQIAVLDRTTDAGGADSSGVDVDTPTDSNGHSEPNGATTTNTTFGGTVGVLRDITERKRNERRLRKQNERLDAFARIVSHDLRNPLGIAQGYLDLIDETGSLEHLPTAQRSLDRMEAIIHDVLAIARDGTWASDTGRVDLETVASEAWEHVSTGEATLTLTGTTTFMADRSRLLRVFENLFRNAIEHGCPDEQVDELAVRVGVLEYESDDQRRTPITDGDSGDDEQVGGPCGFFVADNGSGLPDDLAANDDLFDPSISSETDSLGIGLWIVREVATGHDWHVRARESEAGGARFEFVTGDAEQ